VKTALRLLIVVALLAAAVSSESLGSELLQLRGEGWYSWRVAGDDDLVIYARIESGAPVELRLPGVQCTRRPLPDTTDLGAVDAAESIAWLRRFIAPRSKVSTEVMAAVSLHDTAEAVDALVEVLKSDPDRRNREEAVFWLAQSKSDAAFAALDHLLR
jgi:hypothetical protein